MAESTKPVMRISENINKSSRTVTNSLKPLYDISKDANRPELMARFINVRAKIY
jgi:hypothetical protein